MPTALWILLIIVAIAIIKKISEPNRICTNCIYAGHPKQYTPGNIVFEIFLWLFVIPGLLYTMMRSVTKKEVCPECGQIGMIPINTPRGQQLLTQVSQQKDIQPKRLPRSQICPVCGYKNLHPRDFCHKCHTPFTNGTL